MLNYISRKIATMMFTIALLFEKAIVLRYKIRFGVDFKFVHQGWGAVFLDGTPGNFIIHRSSQLKAGAYIECKGVVEIRKGFHTGRNLVVLSSNHDYRNSMELPYGTEYRLERTVIGNYVWCGANVTILPGTVLEDGCIVSAGAVVRGHFPRGSIVAGNPATVVSSRDLAKLHDQLENAR